MVSPKAYLFNVSFIVGSCIFTAEDTFAPRRDTLDLLVDFFDPNDFELYDEDDFEHLDGLFFDDDADYSDGFDDSGIFGPGVRSWIHPSELRKITKPLVGIGSSSTSHTGSRFSKRSKDPLSPARQGLDRSRKFSHGRNILSLCACTLAIVGLAVAVLPHTIRTQSRLHLNPSNFTTTSITFPVNSQAAQVQSRIEHKLFSTASAIGTHFTQHKNSNTGHGLSSKSTSSQNPLIYKVIFASNSYSVIASGIPIDNQGDLITASDLVNIATRDIVALVPNSAGNLEAESARLLGSDPITGISVLRIAHLKANSSSIETDDSFEQSSISEPLEIDYYSQLDNSQLHQSPGSLARTQLSSYLPDILSPDAGSVILAASQDPMLGGAVVDKWGNIQGLVTKSLQVGPAKTIVAAAPISLALKVGREIVQNGYPLSGWIGISCEEFLNPQSNSKSVVVSSVANPSPAYSAGILPGDTLISILGTAVTDLSQVQADIALQLPGTTLEVTVERNGVLIPLFVSVGQQTP
jgi:S1-C subfamily serine protease